MQPHRPLMPYLATLAGVGLYSLMDALMKGASMAGGVYSALLWRSLIGAVLAGSLWRWQGGRWPQAAAARLHVLRGAVSAGMALTFFWGLTVLPMAEAIAISFLAPLIALYLAAILLGEQIHRRAVAASIAGLAGVALIGGARIGASGTEGEAALGVAAILVSAVLYAWNLILQRQLSLVASPLEVTTFMNGTVALLLLPAAPFLAALPTHALPAVQIAASAVLAVAALSLFTWAYARAEAQALVPLEYSAFIWAAIMGWAMFGERLTWTTLAGTALVVAACWIAAPRGHTEQTAV